MTITLRLLLGYFLIVGLAAWFVLNVFTEEVKPGVRQAMEDSLVDTSQLLAELAAEDLAAGTLAQGRFAAAVDRYRARQPRATIWGFSKDAVDLRVYVTDTRGIVAYDSAGTTLGQDYSRWNDVYLTLRGRYGARSTRMIPADDRSSVMHVAAPVMQGNDLIGVLTVAKPAASVQPFIDRSMRRIEGAGWWLMGGALLIGLLITGWLRRSVGLLRRYAIDLGQGRKATAPRLGSSELAELAAALAEMREKLDGREYVENYVHHLAHEMKSPLTALIGAAELLEEGPPERQRAMFVANIRAQGMRLKDMLDKLLALARIEHRDHLEEACTLDLQALVATVVADLSAVLQQHGIVAENRVPAGASVKGEPFLLRQALANLLDNAIAFSPAGAPIIIDLESADGRHVLHVRDHGPGIPDYALPRIFERFYSLPRPGQATKGTGLGLPFVQQAAWLHGGSISLGNHPDGGVEARLSLPAA